MRRPCCAIGCTLTVPVNLLMCVRHWRRVPRAIQREIYATYRPGQEVDRDPSDAYMVAYYKALLAVADAVGRAPQEPRVAEARAALERYQKRVERAQRMEP